MLKKHLRRIKWTSLVGAILIFVLLFLFGVSQNLGYAADEKIRIFSGVDEHWVILQVAVKKGYFKEAGLNAEVTVFTSGAAATEAFRAGRGDFISAGDLPSAAMWKSGNVIGIFPMSSDTDIFGIVGHKSINLPKDMIGKKVATKIGSTGEFLLYRYLTSGGINPSQVDIVNLAPPEMVISMLHGHIAAFSWLAPFTTRAIEASENIKLISSAKGFANNRIIMNVTKDFASKNPSAVKGMVKAVKKSVDFTNANPEAATKIWAEAVQGDPKQSLPVVKLIQYDMTLDKSFIDDMDELAKFMVSKGALKGKINWKSDFDPSYLKAVDPSLVKVELP